MGLPEAHGLGAYYYGSLLSHHRQFVNRSGRTTVAVLLVLLLNVRLNKSDLGFRRACFA